jgi:UPF0755 protein
MRLRIADCGLRIGPGASRPEGRTAARAHRLHSAIRNPQSAIALLLVLACGAPPAPCDGSRPQAGCVTITVPRGASFADAVDSLAARGVIGSPTLFSVYARIRGLPGVLKSGTYRLPIGADYDMVVRTLRVGRGVEVRWVVREGLMLSEVAALAAAELRIPRDSFLAAAQDPAVLAGLGLTGTAESAEGYLFPTTYQLPVGIGAADLVRLMTEEFENHWRPAWDRRLRELAMTRHQLITLASIVESEVRYGPDREYVSAVYHNRLRRRMPLQADPTVIYAHGQRLPRVWEKHLRIRSPYNTYLHAGLPPGPISQPGAASIEAALFPKPVPYLYFVAQWDGKHVFSTTYAQHLEAIERLRRRRR